MPLQYLTDNSTNSCKKIIAQNVGNLNQLEYYFLTRNYESDHTTAMIV